MAEQASFSNVFLGAEAVAAPRRRVAVVASLTTSLVNFRLEILRRLVRSGAEVTAFAPERDPQTEAMLKALGVRFVQIPMARTGINPVQDLGTLWALWREFRALRPDMVLPYTMKPIIYANIAARLAGVKRRFALCTGLGFAFIEKERSVKRRLARAAGVALYRAALGGAERIFVYNDTDAEVIRRELAPRAASRVTMVPGSGVDTERYPASVPPEGPPVFLMVARLMRDKGVREYAEACRILRARHPDAVCRLLGPFDANPSSVSPQEVEAWVKAGVLDYLGETRDVRPHLAACSVFVLPSFREGISRTVLEAMSTGRAVITTDAPGCPDPVADGETGVIVPAGDAEALAAAMERFVAEPELIARMGAAGRARACAVYDVHSVNSVLMRGMGLE